MNTNDPFIVVIPKIKLGVLWHNEVDTNKVSYSKFLRMLIKEYKIKSIQSKTVEVKTIFKELRIIKFNNQADAVAFKLRYV